MKMSWGDPVTLPIETDGGAVEAGEVSISYLNRLAEDERPGPTSAERALADALSAAGVAAR